MSRRIGIIVAMNPERVIGLRGTIPWRHPGDQRRFKRLTVGTTVVMGKKTWDSLPRKPLPERRNVVLSRTPVAGVECFPDLGAALAAIEGDVWVIGGARAYEEAMKVADLIDVTYVPDRVDDAEAVRFPPIDEWVFEALPLVPHEDAEALTRREFKRRVR